MTDAHVTLSRQEQEYLLHALETALDIGELRQLFLWSQGALQAVLPHRVMACVRLGSDGEPLRIDCLQGGAPAPALADALCDPAHGVALLAQRCWQHGGGVPLLLQRGGNDPADSVAHGLLCRLAALGLDNLLAHGSANLPGGSTFFLLCGLPQRPAARQAHFLRLLLPQLHLALQRICVHPPRVPVSRELSPRETQVLRWLREGKSNDEIGQILGISGLTVKNHLQRLYRLLGVSNRAHAVARSNALPLAHGVRERVASRS